MGLIINIAEALRNRDDYNILREPINDMLAKQQEAFERENPIDLLYKRGTIDRFQQTYTSSIGFARAFAETSDYAVAPIFNNEAGFSKVYTSRTFQGGFIITQQVLEDQDYNTVKDTANEFIVRWHGDQVEYAMAFMGAGFGKEVEFGDETLGVSRMNLTSADTVDGDVLNTVKNPLFSKNHTIVKRRGMTNNDVLRQSNIFAVTDGESTPTYGLDLDGADPEKIAKLADVINQVITEMENYKNDNGKFAGVLGQKTIVAPNDARLVGMLNTALETDMFKGLGMNPAYKRAILKTTPYLRDLACCFQNGRGVGFFIVDKAYNDANHGPEFTERVALTMNVDERKNPYGIAYDARQRFDINAASWRGIVYVYIGDAGADNANILKFLPTGATMANNFTLVKPIATLVKPVVVMNQSADNAVATKEVTGE